MSAGVPSTLGGGRWRILVVLVVNGGGQAAMAVAAAAAAERLFRALEPATPRSGPALGAATAVLAGAAVATAALRGRERVDAERLGQAYTHRLRLRLFEHLIAMPPRAVQARTQGATALRFIGDLTAVQRWVSRGLARLVVAGSMSVVTVAVLIGIEPLLGVTVAVAVAIGAAGLLSQGAAVRATTRHARRRRARLAGNVNEKIGAIGVVRAHGAIGRERRRVDRQSRQLREAMVTRARRLGRLDAVVEATASATTAAVLVVGVVAGLPAPTVAAAMIIVGLLVPQLRGLGRVQEYWQGRRVAMEAIGRFLARPVMAGDDRRTTLPAGQGRLELRSIGVAGSLADVSAAVDAGRTVAVVGPSGAGKSTLLAVIAQLVEPDEGEVLLDGHDLATVELDDVRRALALASADVPLLRGTVRANLTYGCPDATDEDVRAVVARCRLDDVVAGIPGGVDGRITEAGRDLSAGQRQRMLLARAVLGAPRLLLLDEVDANLDARTALAVDDVLDEHRGTALVVTHRRARAAAADEVWVLVDGRLVQRGAPVDVLTGTGPAAALFALGGGVAS